MNSSVLAGAGRSQAMCNIQSREPSFYTLSNMLRADCVAACCYGARSSHAQLYKDMYSLAGSRINRAWLIDYLGLQEGVLRPEAIEYTLERFEEVLTQKMAGSRARSHAQEEGGD
jgi:hypothetical protein